MIDIKKLKCPLCSKGIPTIEVDSIVTKYPYGVDYHCTNCDIWVGVKDVTDEEKAEMFEW